ncbi:DedA family protein [Bordetella genomosp. 4]|uniref:VTT domain-containing protein n=1 Tax=Bordetella genomosp. 4 TaxID=463044 RepID=A0A261TLT0_9BORD|nr:DedA family protein [Bordetella genomosp. 4]OZI50626.1 hypothetical protein CAL20_22560 [Bordetella genomosp. 4]
MVSHELIAHYGVLVVFLNVLGASLGLPVPVMPTLITIGASCAIATPSASAMLPQMAVMLAAAVAGGVLGDLIWFQGGKRYGERTLHTVCSLSLSRESCITRTENFFSKWGVRLLIVARFVPGLSLVSVPLCGAMAVRLRSFLWHDCAGVALWASAGLMIGGIFASQIEQIFAMLSDLGWHALLIAGSALALYILYRYCRRAMMARTLRKAQIGVESLQEFLEH